MTEPSALAALANRIETINPSSVKIKTDARDEWQDRFIIALNAEDKGRIVAALRAAPAQGEPVAYRWRTIGCDWWIYRDEDDFPDGAGELQPLYAALPSSPAPDIGSLNSGESDLQVTANLGAGETTSPADLAEVVAKVRGTEIAEDCAGIAEGHVGVANDPNYDEACRDIAKAIRDTHGARP